MTDIVFNSDGLVPPISAHIFEAPNLNTNIAIYVFILLFVY